MKLHLVSEEMFSPNKSKLVYKRFLEYIDKNPADALCIANSTSTNLEEINAFKVAYAKKGRGMIFSNDTPLLIYNFTYPLISVGLKQLDGSTIYAADDAICVIEITRENEVSYHYIALDLFANSVPVKKEIRSFEFPLLKEIPKDGKPLVMPLEKFIEMIEENMDDDMREKIKKAKQDFHSKTKS